MLFLSVLQYTLVRLALRIIGRVEVSYMQVLRRPDERDDYARLRANRSSPFPGLNEGATPVNQSG